MSFDESKTGGVHLALAALVAKLRQDGFELVDCQQQTRHLASFGARPIPRADFVRRLQLLINSGTPVSAWRANDVKAE